MTATIIWETGALSLHKRRSFVNEMQSSILPELWDHVNHDEISISLVQSVQTMRIIWNLCDDFKMVNLQAENETGQGLAACWLSGIIDQVQLQEIVLRTASRELTSSGTVEALLQNSSGSYQAVGTYQEASRAVACGQAILFIAGEPRALSINVASFPAKSFQSPENEPTIEDPQVAFVNNLSMNMGVIRNVVRSPFLKSEQFTFGTLANDTVALVYIEGMADKGLLEEARKRLHSYKLEGVTGINYIKEAISDNGFSPFPLLDITERPDRVITATLQGRIAILAEGTSMALLAPTTFISLLNSIEDYYTSYFSVLFIRILRHFMYWTSMLLPSFYIVLLAYRPDLLPTPLLLSIQSQHTGIPFPIAMEIILMQVAFEAIREAGIRLPKAVGQSVSIVGALVIGDAATRAGLVSPGAVIVVAFGGIASFTIPSYSLAYTNRVLQFGFMLMAAVYGFYGVIILGLALVGHLVSLQSFGVPYMSPVAPFAWERFRFAFYRPPWGSVNKSHESVSEIPLPKSDTRPVILGKSK